MGAVDGEAERDGSTLDHRDLRSALEYAVLMAGELTKRRPPLPAPSVLKPFANGKRLTNQALGRVRRAVENDPEFRRRIAAGALPELVDEVGRLWLARPDGWEEAAELLVGEARDAEQEHDLRRELKAEEKRRRAAEAAAARVRAEIIGLETQVAEQAGTIESLEADLAKALDHVDVVRAELTDARNELRHARDRERGALERLERALGERDQAAADAKQAAEVRDDALAAGRAADATADELRSIAADARLLAERAASLVGDETEREIVVRSPLALPGGVSSRSVEAAEFFIRSNAEIIVDGYNVSKLAQPESSLEAQRTWLIDSLENVARRFGTRITIVFDGAEVVGSHARSRRLVRVTFSRPGVIADDVIRELVQWHPISEPVVVVTADAEIVRDVRRLGANTLPSAALVGVL